MKIILILIHPPLSLQVLLHLFALQFRQSQLYPFSFDLVRNTVFP